MLVAPSLSVCSRFYPTDVGTTRAAQAGLLDAVIDVEDEQGKLRSTTTCPFGVDDTVSFLPITRVPASWSDEPLLFTRRRQLRS